MRSGRKVQAHYGDFDRGPLTDQTESTSSSPHVVISNTPLESRTRFLRVAAALLAVVVVALLTMLALSRQRASVLDGRWELILIELPTESVQPTDFSWIEFQDDEFHGVGECLTFRGVFALPSERRISIADMTSSEECAPLSPVDDAYTDQFSTISSYTVTEGGFLTLQSRDAVSSTDRARALMA